MDWDSRQIRDIVESALREIVRSGDVSVAAAVAPNVRVPARIVAGQELVCAGLPLAVRVFRALDTEIEFPTCTEEGQRVGRGTELLRLKGKAGAILSGEHTALNFLERLSGIATLTRRFVEEIAGTGAKIQNTWKTSPGLRALEQYAVRVGGGTNGRSGLCDGILLERDHIALAGGIKAALDQAHSYIALKIQPRAMTAYEAVGTTPSEAEASSLPLQIEVRDENELRAALEAGAESVLLNGMQTEQTRRCVQIVHDIRPECVVEIGGHITLANVRAYAVAVNAITETAPPANVRLLVDCAK
jgi:nicotinate-nucleotide pyrophosphorylase (carboxylating)